MKLKDKQALIADKVLCCLAIVNIIVMIVAFFTDNYDYASVALFLVCLFLAASCAIRAKRVPEPHSTNYYILKWGFGVAGIMGLCAELYSRFFKPVD